MAHRDRNHNEITTPTPMVSAVAAHFDRVRTQKHPGSEDDNTWPQVEMGENDHDTQPPNQNITVPLWQRELAASRVGRHSRASSVFSTGTKVTVQSEDARSVEIQAGGQSFRISRHGVTDVTAPPPYSAQPLHQLVEESDEEISTVLQEDEESQTPSGETKEARDRQSPATHSLPLRPHVPPGAIEDGDTATEGGQVTSTSQVLEFPRRLINMFSLNRSTAGVPLPHSTDTNSTGMLWRTQSDSSSVFHFQNTPQESTPTSKSLKSHQSHHSLPELPVHSEGSRFAEDGPDTLFEDAEDDEVAAEVSRYYNRVMRDLDRDYRRQLHARDVELARSRELLNEKDIVYRQQLRDRDTTIQTFTEQLNYRNETINQLKTQVFELEESIDRRLEQARHQIEAMWEKRWKEYEKLLRSERNTTSRRMSVVKSHTPAHQRQDIDDDDDEDSHDK